MFNKFKHCLKKISLLNKLNTSLKGFYQYYKNKSELAYYRRQAARHNLKVSTSDELRIELQNRLNSKGINPKPKQKGNLHIFLAYEQNNWESVLPRTLQCFGKLTTFEWKSSGYNQSSNKWISVRGEMNNKMLKCFEEADKIQRIDAFVGYLCGYNISTNILNEFTKSGTPIFNFCWDDKLFFKGPKIEKRFYGLAEIASSIDLNLTNAPDSIIKYTVHGGLAKFWPEAAHPDIHKPHECNYLYDVSFVGKKYGYRPALINYLRRNGINVTAFGQGWENGSLSDEEMIKLYSKSRINLGFAGVAQSNKLMCLKGRDFEIPMSGGLYLTQDNPELKLVYAIGNEILTYENKKACLEKIKWILNNPSKAENIRKNGRSRALKDHTWEKRFEEIFRLSHIMA
ncbi:MAG: glycosyltransferase [Elusimicrobia bacterium]|nr:glycosyltransferase [Elusimicrobiota bacterium]